MNLNEVYQLMDKFEASSLSELALEMEGVKLSVKKGVASGVVTITSPVAPTVAGAENTGASVAQNTVAQTAIQDKATGTKEIKAPLVGTFYRAAAPGEKPFVEIGQQVKAGDVVGIIEAMKLMNEITATEDGVVEAIEAEDGKLVEYGQVLIRLNQ